MAQWSRKAKNFKYEISAGAVIFRPSFAKASAGKGNGREYLLLLYDFPAKKSRHFPRPRGRDLPRPSAGMAAKGLATGAKRLGTGREQYWGFPKGLVEREKKESLEEAALREIQEETGLSGITFIPGFKRKIHYFFRHADTFVSKDAVYFLAKANPDAEVKISWEHAGFNWLPYPEARALLSHKNHQEVLDAAEEFLNRLARA